MNKNDIISAVADQLGISRAEASKFVKTFFESIKKALKKGDEVRFVGFGTFYTSKRKAQKGRNPQTGAEIKIPASTLPKFRAGKDLKDAVNG